MAPEEKQTKQARSGAAKSGADPGPAAEQLRFEDAYGRLEQLVSEMESAELPLEELLARFEEGVKLVRHCQGFLKQAQFRIEQFVEQKDGRWVLREIED